MKNAGKLFLFTFILLITFTPTLFAQVTGQARFLRPLNAIFPDLNEEQRELVFTEDGLVLSHERNIPLSLMPSASSGIDSRDIITRLNYPYLTETLLIVPHPGRIFRNLDAYNALGRIRDLSGRLYSSATRGEDVPLFQEATRISSNGRNTLADPPFAQDLPVEETIYVRLRDTNFGNTFYRADFSRSPFGVFFNLSNTRNITYLLFTVMREGRFNAIIYMEPIQEGMMVYSVEGADVSEFMGGMIHVPSAISKRIEVFIGWVADGLRAM